MFCVLEAISRLLRLSLLPAPHSFPGLIVHHHLCHQRHHHHHHRHHSSAWALSRRPPSGKKSNIAPDKKCQKKIFIDPHTQRGRKFYNICCYYSVATNIFRYCRMTSTTIKVEQYLLWRSNDSNIVRQISQSCAIWAHSAIANIVEYCQILSRKLCNIYYRAQLAPILLAHAGRPPHLCHHYWHRHHHHRAVNDQYLMMWRIIWSFTWPS